MERKKSTRYPSLAALAKARKAKDILDDFQGPIPTVEELATKVLMNRVCLSSAFKRLYQVPIVCYAREQKIKQMKTLLLDYTQTLESISLECGYNSAPALVRFFKQMEGICPGMWRRENMSRN
jgi:AraC-like DNA-binding protein